MFRATGLRGRFNIYMDRTVIIVSITSDIGTALAKHYAAAGCTVFGTYRSDSSLSELKNLPNTHLFQCDLSNKAEIYRFAKSIEGSGKQWDTFICCAGTENPIGPFFECSFDEWSSSIHVNAIEQLRILHALYAYRKPDSMSHAVYFAGGGTNNAVNCYSAYTASKIMLIKMCELLDSENPDMNVFIVGPGWVQTKIHRQTVDAGAKAGDNFEKVKNFLAGKTGTSMDDIFNCIEWLIKKEKNVSGGRNFSAVHDAWKQTGQEQLAKELLNDKNMYKLRRNRNEWRA